MKKLENAAPTVLLEVVAAAILLSVVMTASVLADRPVIMPTLSPFQAGHASTGKVFLQKLALIENKIDQAFSGDGDAAPGFTPAEIKSVVDARIKAMMPGFEELDAKVQRLASRRDSSLAERFKALDDRVDALAVEGINPVVLDELRRKIAALSAEHDGQIAPTLKMLSKKVELLMQKADSRSSVAVDNVAGPEAGAGDSPLTHTEAHIRLAMQAREVLARHGIESTIDPRNNRLQLPAYFDFGRGAATMSARQMEKIPQLADAMAEIFLCFANFTEPYLMEKCQNTKRPITLNGVLIKVFSVRGNVGTKRFKYNWRLAGSRSVQVLKALVEARQDMLDFANSHGASMFSAVAELTKTAKRSRRVELEFVIDR